MEPVSPAPPQKKKMGALGWLLIGCLGLLVVAGAVFVVGGYFVARKVKSVAEDFERDPVRAAAELAVRVNPDLELVAVDEQARTMTIRDRQSGEEATFDWSQIESGEFSFSADGQEVTLDAAPTPEGGVVTLRDGSGDAVATLGAAAPGGDLDWFPRYPGASEITVGYTAETAEGAGSFFTFTTPDAVPAVLDFYEARLGEAGFELSRSTFTTDGAVGGTILGWTADQGHTFTLVVGQEDGTTQVGVNSHRKP